MRGFSSWNRYPDVQPAGVVSLSDRSAPLPAPLNEHGSIAYGNGRSYSGVCLSDGGTLLHTRALDRFVAFDDATGVLRAEAGILLDEILTLCVPRGWFLPVVPGTRFVTLGGAIANDVHGKNHHAAGTFGCHVRGFELLRSDASRRWCSATEHAELFAASIGGLGVTGLITQAEIQLVKIDSSDFDVINRRFASLDEFFALDAEFKARHPYTVAWIDCLARGAALGRGVYSAGDHCRGGSPPAPPRFAWRVPFMLPLAPFNRWTVGAFNFLQYHRPLAVNARVHYQPWLFPLDAIAHWHRLYGRPGFVQFQCVVPPAAGPMAVRAMLERIAATGDGSPLAVLKTFGARRSPGLLSFPMEGVTLALDFPLRGERTLALCAELYAIVRAHGGRIYPAKDSTSPSTALSEGFPRLDSFRAQLDPAFRSDYLLRHRQGLLP